MKKASHIFYLLAGVAVLFMVNGCSKEEEVSSQPDESVSVRFDIVNDILSSTKAPGDAALSVNRVLILPLRKTSEGLNNDSTNFVPDYNLAKQVDVNSFPSISTKLNLSTGVTYRIMAIGYNRNDYDYGNQISATRTFDIGPGTAVTQANFYLKPVAPTVVPEFFSCLGTGYMNTTAVGKSFTLGQINKIQGELKRIVCGFTLDISNIPGYVQSLTLVAEQLVTATRAMDGTPLLWQTAGDTGYKTFSTLTPQGGKVTFNQYMLPTLDAHKTLFYLDVKYGGVTERYTLKIADNAGVVSGNRITFSPNHWVKVTGNYANINLGFVFSDNINLDDNAWDGLQ